jgi:hypothetical protein
MSKAISYYDWELSYHEREGKKENIFEKQKKDQTSIGISKETLKNFLEKWKNENLT